MKTGRNGRQAGRSLIFAEKLTRLKQQHGLSNRELAAVVGADQSQVYKWFATGASEHSPTAMQRLILARYFDVPVDYLIDDDMDELPTESDGQIRMLMALLGKAEVLRRLLVLSPALPEMTEAAPAYRPTRLVGRKASDATADRKHDPACAS